MSHIPERLKSLLPDFDDDFSDGFDLSSTTSSEAVFGNYLVPEEHNGAFFRIKWSSVAVTGIVLFTTLALKMAKNPSATAPSTAPKQEPKTQGNSLDETNDENDARSSQSGPPKVSPISKSNSKKQEKTETSLDPPVWEPPHRGNSFQPNVVTPPAKMSRPEAKPSSEPHCPDLVEEALEDCACETLHAVKAPEPTRTVTVPGKCLNTEIRGSLDIQTAVSKSIGDALHSMTAEEIDKLHKNIEGTRKDTITLVACTLTARQSFSEAGLDVTKADEWAMGRQRVQWETEAQEKLEDKKLTQKAVDRQQDYVRKERRHKEEMNLKEEDTEWQDKLEKARDECYSASLHGFWASVLLATIGKLSHRRGTFLDLVKSMFCACIENVRDQSTPFYPTEAGPSAAGCSYESSISCSSRCALIFIGLLVVHFVLQKCKLPAYFHQMANGMAIAFAMTSPSWSSSSTSSNAVKNTILFLRPYFAILLFSVVGIWVFHSRVKSLIRSRNPKGFPSRNETNKEIPKFEILYWAVLAVPILVAVTCNFASTIFMLQQIIQLFFEHSQLLTIS